MLNALHVPTSHPQGSGTMLRAISRSWGSRSGCGRFYALKLCNVCMSRTRHVRYQDGRSPRGDDLRASQHAQLLGPDRIVNLETSPHMISVVGTQPNYNIGNFKPQPLDATREVRQVKVGQGKARQGKAALNRCRFRGDVSIDVGICAGRAGVMRPLAELCGDPTYE